MDTIGPLAAQQVTGRFAPAVETVLVDDPGMVASAARALVDSHFPGWAAQRVHGRTAS